MSGNDNNNGMIVIAEAKGVTPEQISTSLKDIMSAGVPKGIATQFMGKTPDGVLMITVWNDATDAGPFIQDRVLPTLKKNGIEPKLNKVPLLKTIQHT